MKKGIILEANLTAAALLGRDRSHLIRQPLTLFISREDQDIYYHCHKMLVETQTQQMCEIRMLRKDSVIFWTQTEIITLSGIDGAAGTLVVIVDIGKLKQAERRQTLSTKILGILNNPPAMDDAISSIITTLKREVGFDAIGIRLQRGDDFPYIAQDGFSKEFILAENALAVRTQDGGVCVDKDGNISLECTCGMVISGKTDPTNPIFTLKGSCWTNESCARSDLQLEDKRLHPRNRCVHEGFHSVALIPLRASKQIVGILQLNDRRPNQFTIEMISFLEDLGALIGMAIARKRAEDEMQKAKERADALNIQLEAANKELEDRVAARTADLSRINEQLIQEVAERNKVAEDLRKSEEHYRLLAKTMMQGVVHQDANGRIIAMNPAAELILGKSSEQFLGSNSVQEEHHTIRENGEHFPGTEHPSMVALQTGLSLRGVIMGVFNPKLGEYRWISIDAVPVFRPDETRPSEVYTVFDDITERKQAEAALRASEERLRSVLDNSRDVIYRLNVQAGRYEYISPSAQRVTGFSADELMAQDAKTALTMIHPDDLPVVLAAHASLEETGEVDLEYRQRTKNGEYRWLSNHLSLSKDSAGRPLYRSGNLSDITERKQTEQALQESEERYRSILENLQDGYIRTNKEGIVIMASPSAAHILGVDSSQELIGLPSLSLYKNVEDRNMLLEELKERDRVIDFESDALKKDGTSFPVSLNAQFYHDIQGHIQGTEAFIRDITERKQAEEIVKESEAKYRSLFENMISGFALHKIEVDDKGKPVNYVFLEANPAFERLTGLMRKDIIGKRVTDTLPGVENDPANWIGIYGQVALTGKHALFEQYSESLDKWFSISAFSPIKDHFATIFEDITWRKKLEEELIRSNAKLEQRVQERTEQLSTINKSLSTQIEERKRSEDRNVRLTRLYSVLSKVNEAIVRIHDPEELYERVCRIAVEDGLFKMAWIGVIDPESKMVKPTANYGDKGGYLDGLRIYAADMPEGRGPTGRAAFEGKCSISGDIEHDPRMLPWREKARLHGFRSSSAFPLHSGTSVVGALTVYSGEPQSFSDEEIQLLTSLVEDVSFAVDSMANEKKRLAAEEALARINEELEQRIALRTDALETANKELEAFSFSVSHDIRAPLRQMSGFAELLQKKVEGQSDEKLHKYSDAISKGAKKMDMLIEDLLAFSHIVRKEMQKREVNLNTLVTGVIQEIQVEIVDRKIKWQVDELPNVLGDRSLLRLVIINLVSNAVKFTSTRQEAEIKIGCKDDGDKFTCYITDNGVGFDMKYADKLFGVFQRLHPQHEFEGTGIGLANVQRIISRHGGKVWAEGAVGQGAAFYFTLPKTKGK